MKKLKDNFIGIAILLWLILLALVVASNQKRIAWLEKQNDNVIEVLMTEK